MVLSGRADESAGVTRSAVRGGGETPPPAFSPPVSPPPPRATSSHSSSSASASSASPPSTSRTPARMAATASRASRVTEGRPASTQRHRAMSAAFSRRARSRSARAAASARAAGASGPSASLANLSAKVSRGRCVPNVSFQEASAATARSMSFLVSSGGPGNGCASGSTPMARFRKASSASVMRPRNRCERWNSWSMTATACMRGPHSSCASARRSTSCTRSIAASSRRTSRFNARRSSASGAGVPNGGLSHVSFASSAILASGSAGGLGLNPGPRPPRPPKNAGIPDDARRGDDPTAARRGVREGPLGDVFGSVSASFRWNFFGIAERAERAPFRLLLRGNLGASPRQTPSRATRGTRRSARHDGLRARPASASSRLARVPTRPRCAPSDGVHPPRVSFVLPQPRAGPVRSLRVRGVRRRDVRHRHLHHPAGPRARGDVRPREAGRRAVRRVHLRHVRPHTRGGVRGHRSRGDFVRDVRVRTPRDVTAPGRDHTQRHDDRRVAVLRDTRVRRRARGEARRGGRRGSD